MSITVAPATVPRAPFRAKSLYSRAIERHNRWHALRIYCPTVPARIATLYLESDEKKA
jgi:hypothetical protein